MASSLIIIIRAVSEHFLRHHSEKAIATSLQTASKTQKWQ